MHILLAASRAHGFSIAPHASRRDAHPIAVRDLDLIPFDSRLGEVDKNRSPRNRSVSHIARRAIVNSIFNVETRKSLLLNIR